ncbi:hypothetical protein C5167_032119 [Papaver somniferum]|uniref:Uncharacterized protein n=1 Tax=Papaver somniferum TaxID=3469 RepID=A0A4Y7KAJ1_PAPSO|nr:UPF0481 protein At3g47200-like isoform X1 [Papaver somniferum]RZC69018.1 hypothetical protein C5167_032119 [Papaver somniferum]
MEAVGERGNSATGRLVHPEQGISKDEICDIVITINDHLESVYTHKSILVNSCIISRVPSHFRANHKEDLDPRFVSIGPLHHHKPHLIAMEDHKLRFLLRLLTDSSWKAPGVHDDETDKTKSSVNGERAAAVGLKRYCENFLSSETGGGDSEHNGNSMITELVYEMKVMEVEARRCYSEKFNDISASEFVTMMILDGCFIVQLLHLYERSQTEDVEDPLFNIRWMVPNLHRDLLLLENQLPFAVLDKIFEITSASADDSYSLQKLALKFFNCVVPQGTKSSDKKCLFGVHPDNLLHLVRLSFVSSFTGKAKPCFQLRKEQKKLHTFREIIPPYGHNIEELIEAGGKFMCRDNHGLLDIAIKDGVLEIPPLRVDDFVGQVLLNLIAYEQCDRFLEPYFTHYVLFFCGLVRTAKDVGIMHDAGLLRHELRSDEDVVDLFKKLSKGIVVSYECDSYLSETLIQFYKTLHFTNWNKWKKKWREDYFSNPWAFSSFLAAGTLLLLTMIQTFFSIFSYVLPPS